MSGLGYRIYGEPNIIVDRLRHLQACRRARFDYELADHDRRSHNRMMNRIRFGTSRVPIWEVFNVAIRSMREKWLKMLNTSIFFDPAIETEKQVAYEILDEPLAIHPSVQFQWKHYFASINLNRGRKRP